MFANIPEIDCCACSACNGVGLLAVKVGYRTKLVPCTCVAGKLRAEQAGAAGSGAARQLARAVLSDRLCGGLPILQ